MKSKLIIKVEQHFEDGKIVDHNKTTDKLQICRGTNGFGTSFSDSGKSLKAKILEKLREELFKNDCEITL
jgi:hypothetical protein